MEKERNSRAEHQEHNLRNTKSMVKVTVVWRKNKYVVEMNADASLKALGDELQNLTGIKEETMRLIIPQFSNKSSRLLFPFSDQNSQLSLNDASVMEGKSIKMMGVSKDEVDEVLQNAKVDLRIAEFDEEEKRMRQRMSYSPHTLLKLPQGPYIFCEFHTLQILGVELNPPAPEALKKMHMLAADPGIVAVMNKHRWRVGIMTEMAPVGYVGVSPKCILGFNKNHGEEISLRLRTDDLKGFRKYESIKKTLLHELAHMIYSEHNANFYALDKQLNQEAASLEWTKSRGYTLSGVSQPNQYSEDLFVSDSRSPSLKLGGNMSDQLASARASSVAAAYRRLSNASSDSSGVSDVHEEPDPDDSTFNIHEEHDTMDIIEKENVAIENPCKAQLVPHLQPDSDEHSSNENENEPDPDDSHINHSSEVKKILKSDGDADEHSFKQKKTEPDPNDSQGNHSEVPEILCSRIQHGKTIGVPDPNDLEAKQRNSGCENIERLDQNDSPVLESMMEGQPHLNQADEEPDPEEPETKEVAGEPDPDDLAASHEAYRMQIDEPDSDDKELQRIQDPVAVVCNRLGKAIDSLRAELKALEAITVLETLFKIIRNVIDHPDQLKFKRLRKANPIIQKNIANHGAAVEILHMVGFSEDVVSDETGIAHAYLVLKGNDPGLLWLAKSSLEACMA